MKIKRILEETTNSTVYNRARKFMLENKKEIRCSFCPYHKNENFHGRRAGVPASWKKHRKTQYKPR